MKMRKALLILLVLSVICALTACMPAAKYYICPDGHQVLDPKNCEQAPEPAETEEPTEPVAEEPAPVVVKDITPEAQALLDKSVKAITVSFSYFESTNPFVEDLYRVSRERMKIELKNKAVFTSSDAYDTVYYDFTGLNAFGYCERQNKDICPDRNKKIALDYDNYLVKTPFDWLKAIDKAELTGKSKMIDGSPAIEIFFESEGEQGTMFMDSFYGIPLSVNYGGVDYEYKNMGLNTGSLAELVHQEITSK